MGRSPALACICWPTRAQGYSLLPTHPQMTSTDAEGRFSFSEVPQGAYRVWAEKGNLISHAKTLAGERVRVADKADPEPVTLRLFEGCRFRVTVKRKEDQTPLAGAVVRFRWPDIERKFTAGDDGVAIVEGARSQELVFDVRAMGYAVDVRRIAAAKLDTTTELSFTLGPGGQLQGEVRDDQQQPIAGAGVSGSVKRSPANLELEYMKTDKQGRFVIDNIPLDEPIELYVSHEDFLDNRQNIQLAPDADLFMISVDMKPRARDGSILVTVVDQDERPVAGCGWSIRAIAARSSAAARPTSRASFAWTTC